MHPAYSVIFFTTASGAGFGLLALLGALAASGVLAPDVRLGVAAFPLAFALIVAGLLSSTAHLGRKERAWRAFSQWRSSWLSREGVAACATFVPGALFAVGWVMLGRSNGWVAASALATALGCVATVYSTAMIYASLKPIPQWHNKRTVPLYLVFSAMSGLVLLDAIVQITGRRPVTWLTVAAILVTLASFGLKAFGWRQNDRLGLPTSLNAATGLVGGTVRSVEWPHTEENYLLKEMGYKVARKHAARLRRIAAALAFVIPAGLLLASLALPRPAGAGAAVVAAICQLAGLLVERWLFFAEAKHTVTLYYGRA